MAQSNFQEIEWQFEIDDPKKIHRSVTQFVKTLNYAIVEKKSSTQVDTYFDTRDFTYFHADLSLRIRRQGKSYEACFKSLKNSREKGVIRPQARTEITERLPCVSVGALQNAKGELGKKVRNKHPDIDIIKLFSLVTEREKIILLVGSKPFIEIAFDTTHQENDSSSIPLELHRIEIEVKNPELMLNAEDVVDRMKKFLKRRGQTMRPAELSKFMSAMTHNNIKPNIRTFGPYTFSKRQSLESYVVAIFKKYLEAAFLNEAGCRIGSDVEYIHRMRVALRKIMSAYKVLFDYVPANLMPFRRFIKSTISALGNVRDLDVHIAALANEKSLAETAGKPAIDDVVASLRKKRDKAHGVLLKFFNTKAFARNVEALADALNHPKKLYGKTATTGSKYKLIIKDLIEDFHDKGKELDVNAKANRFHRVRIQGKELRYTMEFFKPLAERTLNHLSKIMTRIQDDLGAINDSRIAKERLLELAKKRGAQFSPMALFAMGEACMKSMQEELERRRDFVDEFSKLTFLRLAKEL